MTKRHGLRALQMREAGHYRRGMIFRTANEGGLQRRNPSVHCVHRTAHPQPEIRRDLIIARPRGVKPPGNWPDQFSKPSLSRHMNIFKRQILGQFSRKLSRNLIKPRCDCCRILSAQNPLRAEHRDMRLRSGNILLPQTLVEWQTSIYLTHHRSGAIGKPAAPHLIGILRALVNRHSPRG